ncbi:MAG: 30S ribosomal protein S6 [Acidobacteria bacterium]|nr:30S ribosomal protein S6 [Acidobacteriota bacterium]
MSETRQYEVVYVVSPEITEEGVTELHERIAEIVGQLGGNIDKTDNWGRRRLAYEIDRHREGTYVIELVTGPGTLVTELDRRLRVMEQLLRHLIVRVDEDLRKAGRAREQRQSREQRRHARRAAAGLGAPAAAAPAAAAGAPAP